MATRIECSMMSSRVYDAADRNKTAIPSGWTELEWVSDEIRFRERLSLIFSSAFPSVMP